MKGERKQVSGKRGHDCRERGAKGVEACGVIKMKKMIKKEKGSGEEGGGGIKPGGSERKGMGRGPGHQIR